MSCKRKNKLVLLICIVTVLACVTLMASAGNGNPGSDSDPLVTKSYVDQQIALLSSQIGKSGGSSSGNVDTEVIEQLQTDIGDLTSFVIGALQEIETLKGQIAALEGGFEVVRVDAGQTILLAGGSEAILRSGSATTVGGTAGGLVDATAGKDLNQGDKVPVQHLLISSRSDGRGLKITSDVSKEAYLLIRGAYEIK